MVPFVRREAVTTFIAYQIFPANTCSMIAHRHGMPAKARRQPLALEPDNASKRRRNGQPKQHLRIGHRTCGVETVLAPHGPFRQISDLRAL